MRDVPQIVFSLLTGIVLGTVFFGGLWWTVRRAMHSRRPALFFVVSLLLRTFVVTGGLVVLAQSNWRLVPIGLLGVLLARVAIVRATRISSDPVGPITNQSGP